MKIIFTTQLPHEGFQLLSNTPGVQLIMPEQERLDIPSFIQSAHTDAEILVATFDYTVSKELIDSMPNLQLITNFGVGYNNIDLDACRARGIRVTNTPQPVIEPTAELAFALMHDVARRTAEFDRKLREGKAEPFGVMNNLSHSLYSKTLGIIGMGRIGQALARRAVASGMNIIYHNRRPLSDEDLRRLGYEARYMSKEELLETADFVSLNLPYTPEVKHIIDGKALRMMKPTAYLINTARGSLIDEDALVAHMLAGNLKYACLDVTDPEPPTADSPLRSVPNIIMTPHLAGLAQNGLRRIGSHVADEIEKFLAGKPMLAEVTQDMLAKMA